MNVPTLDYSLSKFEIYVLLLGDLMKQGGVLWKEATNQPEDGLIIQYNWRRLKQWSVFINFHKLTNFTLWP